MPHYYILHRDIGKENIMQECTAAHMENSKQTSRTNSFEIENLLKTAEQVTGICRSPGETRKSSPTGSVVSAHSQALTPSRQLSDAEKLKKVILELIETERTYVKVMRNFYYSYEFSLRFLITYIRFFHLCMEIYLYIVSSVLLFHYV